MIYLIKQNNRFRGWPGEGYTDDIAAAGRYYNPGIANEEWFKEWALTLYPITELAYQIRERHAELLREFGRIEVLLKGLGDE